MLLAPHERGRVAVAQPAHGWMCGQIGRAWGNDRFGAVEPAEEVWLAAEQHDSWWAEWELSPTLDPATGWPHTFASAAFDLLEVRVDAAARLVPQSRYAALLVALHHESLVARSGRLGVATRNGRRLGAFHARSGELARGLRATLAASDAEIDRNRRLVRTWDGLSHDLILGDVGRRRADVPTADGGLVEVATAADGGVLTVEPWPFAAERVVVRTEGRLLDGPFADDAALGSALRAAPWVDLVYELRRV